MENALEFCGITKCYGGKKALDGVNIAIPQGQIIGLLGPNGSGKTTLIKLAAGLLTPTSGTLRVCGQKVGPDSKALVSYLPDKTYFNRRQKIQELLEVFTDFYRDFDRHKAEEMLRELGIDRNARLGSLSKGSQEKVQLVVVMCRKARLYLLDEPIGGVDPAARDYILNTIIGGYEPESTVLISTHLISDVERVLDGFLFLNNGKIVRQGSADEAREETGKSLDELFREEFKCLPNC